MRVHPRVAYQGMFHDGPERASLLARLPALVPFRKSYHGILAMVDWDHRLPSHELLVRVYAYYSDRSMKAGVEALDARLEDIGAKDLFPEFDVPDFGQLPADEAYEMELGLDGQIGECRLTSTWRRKVSNRDTRAAISIARESPEFAQLAHTTSDRPRYLGDLEAVAWTPPLESGHPRWTVDVWYLLAFDGRIGTGHSLLVDPIKKAVVFMRDVTVRAG